MLSPSTGSAWTPGPVNAQTGLIVIVHGLRHGVLLPIQAGEPHWMTQMEKTLRSQLGPTGPDVCLVDWHDAARPSQAVRLAADSVSSNSAV